MRHVMLMKSLYQQRDHARVKELSDRLIAGINARVEHVVRNGDVNGYPGCVNLSFAYVEGESLLMALKVRFFFRVFLFQLGGGDQGLWFGWSDRNWY